MIRSHVCPIPSYLSLLSKYFKVVQGHVLYPYVNSGRQRVKHNWLRRAIQQPTELTYSVDITGINGQQELLVVTVQLSLCLKYLDVLVWYQRHTATVTAFMN